MLAIALANKLARIASAILARGQSLAAKDRCRVTKAR